MWGLQLLNLSRVAPMSTYFMSQTALVFFSSPGLSIILAHQLLQQVESWFDVLQINCNRWPAGSQYIVGTCESAVCVRIESWIELGVQNSIINYKCNKRDVQNYRFLIPILKDIKQYRRITMITHRAIVSLYTVPLSAVNGLSRYRSSQPSIPPG